MSRETEINTMGTNLDRLDPGYFYHIFNRTNNREPLFVKPENYRYFLELYKDYLSAYLDTYAYCLIINHFHFLVRIKEAQELLPFIKVENQALPNFHELVRQQFRKLFIAYAKAFNKQENRYGSLFQRPFKRKAIKNDGHFTHAVFYIHANSVKHKIMEDFPNYPYSSYQSILSDKPTLLQRQHVLDWFGGKQAFIQFHQQPPPFDNNKLGFEE
ncbi:MAG: transposase [Bacteroidetes bacterium]|nr:transposase [Bacteroidota bacterium]